MGGTSTESIYVYRWLEKWKAHYNIKQVVVNGESCDVHGHAVELWKEQLLRWFSKEDIRNLDETGCFWKTLPD